MCFEVAKNGIDLIQMVDKFEIFQQNYNGLSLDGITRYVISESCCIILKIIKLYIML